MTIDLVELSKTLSHALRHEPWRYELEMDDDGWCRLDDMVSAMRCEREAWSSICVDDLRSAIAASDKQRHEIRNGMIRAIYGHSIPGKLAKERAKPPALLFHGTSLHALSAIQREGLHPMARQYVHLSSDSQIAAQVGRRKSKKPVILRVRAGNAHDAGVTFYYGNELVWLADLVPSQYIEFTRLECEPRD